jgi:beta-lactam-binding protein with PASTA domain
MLPGPAPTTPRPSPVPARKQLPPTRGIVPDVVGLNAEEATTLLQDLGYTVFETREADEAPADTVTDQAPAPDVAWPEGSEVTIVVSDGPS